MSNKETVPFGKMNFLILAAGTLLIVIGFIFMTGEKFVDANKYSNSLYLSPVLIILGHGVIVWGILKKNKSEVTSDSSAETEG